MAALTVPAVLAIISAGGCVPPAVAPVIVGIARHESGLNPLAIHDNTTGQSYVPATREQAVQMASALRVQLHDLDLGIAQVNVRNFGWTGLSVSTVFDPCASFAAGTKVLFAKYNGSPPDAVRAAYAADVARNLPQSPAVPLAPDKAVDPCPPPDPDGWHTVARPLSCPEPKESKSNEDADEDK